MNTKRRHTARKSKGTKAKKPKFLSLRLQFPADDNKQIKRSGMHHRADAAEASAADTTADQLDLVPHRPVNQVEERESNDHENVAFYFSATDGGATTLTGLLDTSTAAESNSSHTDNNSSRLDYLPPPSPAALTQAYGEERAALVRNALRSRDRDSSEDKWVCYSEVVKEEEVTSSAVDPPRRAGIHRVSLKLDYEEIMNAWSNKGPLYIDASDNSQIVPDINHHFFSQEHSNHGLNLGCNVGSWTVPEMVSDFESVEMRMGTNGDHELKMGQREASVLRYKEKRQNRLFSRKIRYQVRKLNAEKRPRLKGRFVKRS
ncbi:zinc finger protein constans-like 7 [Phtheirospermum japonicum]|uniref:Zinc finger protein constans-like 7 n=1 Tax=Phtheirospermum japonicum TaxID=374723 RepID=A0A830CDJ2_9LAMI|nr:zinc finger protein constans-like 7 [Phtheirospermum japonicum]